MEAEEDGVGVSWQVSRGVLEDVPERARAVDVEVEEDEEEEDDELIGAGRDTETDRVRNVEGTGGREVMEG